MSRVFDFVRQYSGMRLLGFGFQRGLLWVVGGVGTTAAGVALEGEGGQAARRKGAFVVPLPAAEGFKDPFMEDLLDEVCDDTPHFDAYGNLITENQSVEWLNQSIAPMWPFLDEGLRQFIYNRIEPAIQESVPVVGGSLKFSKLTVGKVAPKLGPVTSQVTDDGVELFVQVDYSGDLALDFELGLASVQIGDLTINGEVLLTFKPLVNGINPIGGLEICCLDQPDITLNLKAKGMLLDAVPNFYSLIKQAVDGAIAKVLVAPYNISVRIPTVTGPVTDYASLKYRDPLGVLRLCVDRAAELPGSSWTMDPYVRLQLGADYWYTDTVPRELNPDFKGVAATQDFLVYHPRQHLYAEVHDQNHLAADALVGEARTQVGRFTHPKRGHESTVTLPLVSPLGTKLADSTLTLKSQWLHAVPVDPADVVKQLPPPTPLSAADSAAATTGTVAKDAATANATSKDSDARDKAKGRDKWRLGTRSDNCLDGATEMITMFRVDRMSLPAAARADGAGGPYRVRVSVGGNTRVTGTAGTSDADNATMLNRDSTRELAMRLHTVGVGREDFCRILGATEAEYTVFAEREAARAARPLLTRHHAVEAKEDDTWASGVRDRIKREMSYTRPNFSEVVTIPSMLQPSFDLEVIATRDDPKTKKPTEYVVGRSRFPLDAKGPYAVGDSVVHGCVKLAVLEAVSAPMPVRSSEEVITQVKAEATAAAS